MKKLIDDCFLHDRDRMKHEDALALLKARISPVVDVETLYLDAALGGACGRVLARDVMAPRPIPLHRNAAVDGFAFAFTDYDPEAGAEFPVIGRSAAGHAFADSWQTGGAVQILTGAAMPHDADTVVMIEDVSVDGEGAARRVAVPAGLKPGANCRLDGEDVKEGEVLYRAGHRIRPQDLAALASTGLTQLDVFARLRVAVCSTGDEVVPVGRDLAYGQVFDANSPLLHGMCEALGVELSFLGILADDPQVVRSALEAAARDYDVVITSGGASRGEEDYIVRTLEEIGQRHMWQIAVKPGRPMSFGQIGDTVFVGLPGNPVAVFVCFLMYGWPLLTRLSGASWPLVERYQVPAAFDVANKKTGRREFWRASLIERDGVLWAEKFARDGSGLISSLRAADGLIDVGEDVEAVREGDLVTFLPLSQYGILPGA